MFGISLVARTALGKRIVELRYKLKWVVRHVHVRH